MSDTNTKPLLNADIQFLVHCCQTELTKEEIDFLLSLITHVKLDIQSLFTLANAHGILPLVYKSLKNLQPDILKEIPELKSDYLSIAQQNISMSATLIKILDLLKKNSIHALSFKGPSLAQMAYNDITLRQFGDLDILINKDDLKKVEEIFISMGYKPYYDLTEVQKEFWYRHVKDMVFYHPKKQSIIEVHWLLLDANFPLQIDLDTIWGKTSMVKLNQTLVPTFSSDSLLLYLCIHGSKHLWERIVWIKDIDLVIRTQNIEWEQILVHIQKHNLERMFFLGLHLSKILFNTPLPKNIDVLLENEKVLSELSDFVFLNWRKEENMFQNTRAMLKFFPTFATKAKYLNKIILKPSNREYRFIDLPKGLYWVYYLVRPYLLLRKYLTKNQ